MSPSPSPASLQADFLVSLADVERRQLCEEDLAGEEEPLWFSKLSLHRYLDVRRECCIHLLWYLEWRVKRGGCIGAAVTCLVKR